MTIYVDQLTTYPPSKISSAARRYGNRWCHLVTDGEDDELHQFAQSIGLHRSWFQAHRFWSHYDLTPTKRSAAIRAGAVEVQSLAQLALRIGKFKTHNSP